jgi:hypothetical protein
MITVLYVCDAILIQVTEDKAIEAGTDIYINAPIDVEDFSAVVKSYFPTENASGR